MLCRRGLHRVWLAYSVSSNLFQHGSASPPKTMLEDGKPILRVVATVRRIRTIASHKEVVAKERGEAMYLGIGAAAMMPLFAALAACAGREVAGQNGGHPSVNRELVRYADASTVRYVNGWVYFSAGHTPGQVCTGQTLNYRVPRDDVLNPGTLRRCIGSTVIYRNLRYRTGG